MSEQKCSEIYVVSGYGYAPNVEVPCFREVPEGQDRHHGQHQGWQDMPAGESGDFTGKVTRWDAWRRLWTWGVGGASGTARGASTDDLEPCPLCGGLTPPATDGGIRFPGSPDAYKVGMGNLGGACFNCRLWADRIAHHNAGWVTEKRGNRTRSIRLRQDDGSPHNRLRMWSSRVTGAFGGLEVTVRWDDGDQAGPASCMWDCGAIPWWLDDQFPANAVLVQAPA